MNGVQLLFLMIGALAVTALSRKSRIPSALLVLIAAGAASFLPDVKPIELEPHVILGVVMPPIIYAAALNTSFFGFMRYLNPIVWLGVLLVVATSFVVGRLTNWLFPTFGLAASFALAAVISPSDTVTALSHAHEFGFPKRVTSILMGESLVNDATALALFGGAMAFAGAGKPFIQNTALSFIYGAIVGAMIGLLLGNGAAIIRSRISGASLKTSIGLVLPFAAYVAAEFAHASGVLAVVFAAFAMSLHAQFTAHPMNKPLDAQTRVQERMVWPVIDALLEAFVFVYMGLQFHTVVEEGRELGASLLKALLILVVALLLRPVMVIPIFRRLTIKERGLVSFLGMRGIVTLAAAGGIPFTLDDGTPFPERATIQFIAFVVTIGSLLTEGVFLPQFAKALGIDVKAEREEEAQETDKARKIAEDAGPDFSAQRLALVHAVRKRLIGDEAASRVIVELDNRELATRPASHTH